MKVFLINNQNGFAGSILLSVVAVLISVIASSSFILLVNMDNTNVTLFQDALQQNLFMRSEIARLNSAIRQEFSDNLPGRIIEMEEEDRVCTYFIKSKKQSEMISYDASGMPKQVNVSQAYISQKYGKQFASAEYSPVVRFIEKLAKRSGLEQYQWFTYTEKSDLSDGEDSAARVKFWGADWLKGPMHSNTDIWIQTGGTPPTGSPSYQGWPVFEGLVTTSGRIRVYPSGALAINAAPVDNIFLGGFEELVPKKDFLGQAKEIRQNGLKPFGMTVSDSKIFICKIEDRSLRIKPLETYTKIDTFVVYKRYPDVNFPVVYGNTAAAIATHIDFNNPLWVNRIQVRDTIWTGAEQTISFKKQSVFLPGVTWVEGRVEGRLTIGSALDAYTTGDIFYKNTEKGQKPDDPMALNKNDFFGLVSEKKIFIKYKYRIKEGNTYVTSYNNSVGPNGHVYLYGAYAAIGKSDPTLGDNAFKAEGVFTYEYQHPHGAVMPFRGKSQFTNRDTVYAFIDLHRHRFPPAPANMTDRPLWHRWPNATPATLSNGFPNPPNNPYPDYTLANSTPLYKTSDYPWYNPVWPEKDAGASPVNLMTDITWERGTLHVFGSISQMRRGFIHRSGNYGDDNPDTGIWDPNNYIYGPPHRSTGYKKDYQYDNRFYNMAPPDFPEIYEGNTAGSMQQAFKNTAWNYKVPPNNF